MNKKLKKQTADVIMGRIPGGLLRWGSSVLLATVFALLGMCWIVRYPETLQAPFRLQHSAGSPRIAVALVPPSGMLGIQNSTPVSLRFAAWPGAESGLVPAVIDSVAADSASNAFLVFLRLENGLRTNRGIDLPEMFAKNGVAEFVTDNPRMIERLIQPVGMLIERIKDVKPINQ